MPVSLSKRTRYFILAAIVLAVLYALLFYTPPRGGLWARTFFDSLHLAIFGVVAASLFLLWQPDRAWTWRAASAMAMASLLGLFSELAQVATGRDASYSDFIVDCLGAAGFLGIVVATGRSHGLSLLQRATVVTAALAMLGTALAPLATVSAAYLERNLGFPVIFAADRTFGRKFIHVQNARYEITDDPQNGPSYATVTFLDAPWPGIAFHDLRPDWRSHARLVIDLQVTGTAPFALNLRIHDRAHAARNTYSDRFNRTFDLVPGRQKLQIPLDDLRHAPRHREMNLGRISELIIFGTRADAGRSIRLYGIRLE